VSTPTSTSGSSASAGGLGSPGGLGRWDPAKYLEFAGLRLRPALDLLARVPLDAPGVVYDLGCGAGNVTRLLAERWPDAGITGVDGSAAMLAKASQTAPALTWVEADLRSWAPPRPADLIFSNAALHWLGDHATLFPRLVAHLAPGGVLAVQMPRNHSAPSHTEMTAAALAGPWRGRLEPLLAGRPVESPETYYDILTPHMSGLDVWETEYLQLLEGAHPVVEWTKGTALRPLLDALDEPDRSAFLADYTARVDRAYPRRPDGRTLFPFRRLFIVVRR
jgi:trans-aconitate 2-methyltransferase